MNSKCTKGQPDKSSRKEYCVSCKRRVEIKQKGDFLYCKPCGGEIAKKQPVHHYI